MRRGIAVTGVIAAAGAVVAGVAVSARGRSRPPAVGGVLPGRAGSWVNSYLGRPGYRLVAGVVDLQAGDELLDVACGWGEFLVEHAGQARRVAGIDLSPEKADLARQRLAERIAGGTAEVVCGDAADLPWPDDTFTAVTCMDAFPLFTDPDRVLAEIRRVLRPGGRVVMHVGPHFPDQPPRNVLHLRNPVVDVTDEAAVQALFERAGFAEIAMTHGPASINRVWASIARALIGTDEMRIVRAVKTAGPPG